jgi:hypothetical protein
VKTLLEQLTLRPPEILKAPNPIPAYPPQGNVPGATFDPNERRTPNH